MAGNDFIFRDLKSLKGISLGALNVKSLFKNLDKVKHLLHESDLDLLLIQEMFLNEYVGEPIIEIPEYHLSRLD